MAERNIDEPYKDNIQLIVCQSKNTCSGDILGTLYEHCRDQINIWTPKTVSYWYNIIMMILHDKKLTFNYIFFFICINFLFLHHYITHHCILAAPHVGCTTPRHRMVKVTRKHTGTRKSLPSKLKRCCANRTTWHLLWKVHSEVGCFKSGRLDIGPLTTHPPWCKTRVSTHLLWFAEIFFWWEVHLINFVLFYNHSSRETKLYVWTLWSQLLVLPHLHRKSQAQCGS